MPRIRWGTGWDTAPETGRPAVAIPTATPARHATPRRTRAARSSSRRHEADHGSRPSGGESRMRRLIAVAAATIAVFGLTGAVHAKKFAACPGGRFVVAATDAPLLPGGP